MGNKGHQLESDITRRLNASGSDKTQTTGKPSNELDLAVQEILCRLKEMGLHGFTYEGDANSFSDMRCYYGTILPKELTVQFKKLDGPLYYVTNLAQGATSKLPGRLFKITGIASLERLYMEIASLTKPKKSSDQYQCELVAIFKQAIEELVNGGGLPSLLRELTALVFTPNILAISYQGRGMVVESPAIPRINAEALELRTDRNFKEWAASRPKDQTEWQDAKERGVKTQATIYATFRGQGLPLITFRSQPHRDSMIAVHFFNLLSIVRKTEQPDTNAGGLFGLEQAAPTRQRLAVRDGHGFVYVVMGNGKLKVGSTTRSVATRIAEVAATFGLLPPEAKSPLVMGWIETDGSLQDIERFVQKDLVAQERVKGECFLASKQNILSVERKMHTINLLYPEVTSVKMPTTRKP